MRGFLALSWFPCGRLPAGDEAKPNRRAKLHEKGQKCTLLHGLDFNPSDSGTPLFLPELLTGVQSLRGVGGVFSKLYKVPF